MEQNFWLSFDTQGKHTKTDKFHKTTCPYCGVGCGVIAHLDQNGVVTVKGDPDHPANLGKLCSKGTALGETVALQERLLYPEMNGEQVSWEQALNSAALGFKQVIEEHGVGVVEDIGIGA